MKSALLLAASLCPGYVCMAQSSDLTADADRLYAEGNHAQALISYDQAIAAKEKPVLYVKRGLAKYALRRDTAAIADFDRAVAHGYDAYDVYYHRGLCRFLLRDYKKSIEDFTQALERRKYHANSYLYRGAAYFYLANDLNAVKDESWAISIDKDNPLSHYFRGMARYQMKDYHVAIKDFNNALALRRDHESFYYRALCYYRLERFRDAIADFSSALELKSGNPQYHYDRAVCLLLEGDNEAALRDFNEVIRIKPSFSGAYHFRGIARKNLADVQGACADFSKSLQAGFNKSAEELEKLSCR